MFKRHREKTVPEAEAIAHGQHRYWQGFGDGYGAARSQPEPRQWTPERIELLVHLELGEAWFPAVYQPMTSMFGQGVPDTYSVAFPADRLLDQAGAEFARFGLDDDSFLVKEGAGKTWSGGRDTLTARSKTRPEVGVLNTGCGGLDFRAGVSFLADLAREADARNISRDQLLAKHSLSLQILATRGDQFSSRYVRPDQYVLGLQKVYVRDPG